MAQRNIPKDIYSKDDPLDINELASLNDDISPEFIEQLQNQVAQNASAFTGKPVAIGDDDTELFEEVNEVATETKSQPIQFDENIDDNFVKKYKAKLNKQQNAMAEMESLQTNAVTENIPSVESVNIIEPEEHENTNNPVQQTEDKKKTSQKETKVSNNPDEIENITYMWE